MLMMMMVTSYNKNYKENVICLVREYLRWLSVNYPNITNKFASELFRYSLCRTLELESTGSSKTLIQESDKCVAFISPFINKYDNKKKPVEYKQGFLECCILYIELARKRCNNE